MIDLPLKKFKGYATDFVQFPGDGAKFWPLKNGAWAFEFSQDRAILYVKYYLIGMRDRLVKGALDAPNDRFSDETLVEEDTIVPRTPRTMSPKLAEVEIDSSPTVCESPPSSPNRPVSAKTQQIITPFLVNTSLSLQTASAGDVSTPKTKSKKASASKKSTMKSQPKKASDDGPLAADTPSKAPRMVQRTTRKRASEISDDDAPIRKHARRGYKAGAASEGHEMQLNFD